MYKNTLIILGLLFFTACSQTTPEVKAELKTPIKIAVKEPVAVREPIKVEVQTEVVKDFIPEHLKHSKIEVVKHY